jgi:archaellum component FlaF (FlaF/FlaG flagellin family)
MGFSVAAAAAIIGVSLLMILEIFAGNTIPLYTEIQDSYKDMKNRAIDELQTMISIQNVTTSPNASNYDVNITVQNTGSTVIDTRYITLLINGTKTIFTSSSAYIYPTSSVYLNSDDLSGNGQKKLKIITKNGISSYETYII